MSKKNDKVSVFYGRARRIEFAEKMAYIFVAILSVFIIVTIVVNQSSDRDRNVNFSFLREHLESRGFKCEMVHYSGGQCSLNTEQSFIRFVRYDDGIEYIYKTNSYLLDIRHTLAEKNYISFKTTSEAFSGYKNKEYICVADNIIGELKECKDSLGNKLDIESYIGLIEQSMKDINIILENSGYYKNELIESNVWLKK